MQLIDNAGITHALKFHHAQIQFKPNKTLVHSYVGKVKMAEGIEGKSQRPKDSYEYKDTYTELTVRQWY